MTSSSDPITNVFIITSKENLKPSINIQKLLSCTQRGYDADLYESSWLNKKKRYLVYEKDPSSSYIITDVRIIKDDEQVPNGFSGIFLTQDTEEKSLKKHVLCVKKEPRQSAAKSVSDLCLINQSKGERADPTFYTISYEVNEMNITFQVDTIQRQASVLPHPQQAQRVNEMSLQMSRNPSLHSNSGPNTQIPTSPIKAPASGIEGVPFTINPKYRLEASINDPIMSSIPVLTVDDINRKFQYDFTMEQEFVQRS